MGKRIITEFELKKIVKAANARFGKNHDGGKSLGKAVAKDAAKGPKL